MEILDIVVHAICEKKAQDVRVYDVTSLTPFMDSMIVCSTTNIRQNNAIAQNIKDRLREAGYLGDMHIEGDSGSKWLLSHASSQPTTCPTVGLVSSMIRVFNSNGNKLYK